MIAAAVFTFFNVAQSSIGKDGNLLFPLHIWMSKTKKYFKGTPSQNNSGGKVNLVDGNTRADQNIKQVIDRIDSIDCND